MLGQGLGQGDAVLDVAAHLLDDRFERGGVGLLGQDGQTAGQAETDVDHRRELPAEDGDRLGLDPWLDDVGVEAPADAGEFLLVDADG